MEPSPDRGSFLEAPFWVEPVEVELLEQLGRYVRVVGRTVRSRQGVSAFLTPEQWNQVRVRSARLCWSVYALLRSLERRKRRLDELLSRADTLEEQAAAVRVWPGSEEEDDLAEAERWRLGEWEALSGAENRKELDPKLVVLGWA